MKNLTNIMQHFLSNQGNHRHPNWHFLHIDNSIRRRRNIFETDCLIFSNEPSESLGKPKRSKLLVKNMVSFRCIIVVKAMLDFLKINYSTVEIGEVEIVGNLSDAKREQFKCNLLECGLGLIENKKLLIVEKIKKVIIEMIHFSDELPNLNFSDYISEKMKYNYTYLANLFSEETGISIQQFIILQRIERVKELMLYEDLTLSEIAWKTHYSSVAHLSFQFKNITGLSPSDFKKLTHTKLNSIDNLIEHYKH